ncbi:MAG: hypothetical protein WHV66_00120 [Anaerolineales bacterium]
MSKIKIPGSQQFSVIPAKAALDKRISNDALRTLAVLGCFGDLNGWWVLDRSTLAQMRGVRIATIDKHIQELVSLGYLKTYTRRDPKTDAQIVLVQICLDNPTEEEA